MDTHPQSQCLKWQRLDLGIKFHSRENGEEPLLLLPHMFHVSSKPLGCLPVPLFHLEKMACLWFTLHQILALVPSRQVHLKEMMIVKTCETVDTGSSGFRWQRTNCHPSPQALLHKHKQCFPWSVPPSFHIFLLCPGWGRWGLWQGTLIQRKMLGAHPCMNFGDSGKLYTSSSPVLYNHILFL